MRDFNFVEHLKLGAACICNLPGVDVTRVACLAELQGLRAAAAATIRWRGFLTAAAGFQSESAHRPLFYLAARENADSIAFRLNYSPRNPLFYITKTF